MALLVHWLLLLAASYTASVTTTPAAQNATTTSSLSRAWLLPRLPPAAAAAPGPPPHHQLLAAAAAPPAVETGALRCSSFYDFFMVPHYSLYYNTTFEEIASWMNCPSFGVSAGTVAFSNQLWQAGHQQRMLWKVADTAIWTYPCHYVQCGTVAKSGLVDGWEKLVDAMVATVKTLPDYAARTEGWNLGDELLAEGIPLANVSAVARRIRQQFGVKTFIYWNETPFAFDKNASLPDQPCTGAARCAASPDPHGCCLNGPGGVPSDFDVSVAFRVPSCHQSQSCLRQHHAHSLYELCLQAISVDVYGGELSRLTGLPDPNSTCPDAAKEATCVFDYLRRSVYPHLSPTQRVYVVPGTYGAAGCLMEATAAGRGVVLKKLCTGDAAAKAQTDRVLTAKFELYWELAVKDPLVIGECNS